jgi:hypothetical protein
VPEASQRFPALMRLMPHLLVEFMLFVIQLLTPFVALALASFFAGLSLALFFAVRHGDFLPFDVGQDAILVAFLCLALIEFLQAFQAMLRLIGNTILIRVFRLGVQDIDEIVDPIAVEIRMPPSNLVKEMRF